MAGVCSLVSPEIALMKTLLAFLLLGVLAVSARATEPSDQLPSPPDGRSLKLIWQDEWHIHWPGGPEDPELVLLKMTPKHAKGWYKEGAFEFKLK
jgi:hypothetical protein